jgi:hypothetical protein
MKRKSSERNSSRQGIARLEDIPNVGPAIAADLLQLGITTPAGLSAASRASVTILACWTRSSPSSVSWKVGRRSLGGSTRRKGSEL